MSEILTATAPLVATATTMVDLATAETVTLSEVVKGKNTIIGKFLKIHYPPKTPPTLIGLLTIFNLFRDNFLAFNP